MFPLENNRYFENECIERLNVYDPFDDEENVLGLDSDEESDIE